MNVLVLSAESPVPPNSGFRQRTLHLARELTKVGAVDVACLGPVPDAGGEPFRLVGAGRPNRRALAFATAVFRPYLAAKFDSRELQRLAGQPGWDTIQAELPFLVPPPDSHSAPIVLDAHNVESELAASVAAAATSRPSRIRWRWEAAKISRFESAVVGRVAAVCATSDEDARALTALGAERVLVVPNGVDVEAVPARAPAPGQLLAYTGHLGYRPNAAAALELVDAVLPRVRRRCPDARAVLIGRDPGPDLVGRAGPHVEVTGPVDAVLPHLRRARVLVVPLRAGSGTRLKVLEAMAAGVPVVSTRLGVAGLAVGDGEHVLLGESADELADQAARVIEDDGLAAGLSARARTLVETRYSWPVVAQPLLELHTELAHRARAARA